MQKKTDESKNADGKLSVSGQIDIEPSLPFDKKVIIDVALPCYGAKYHSTCMFSLIDLLAFWAKSNIEYTLSEVDICDIEFARNLLITNFYYNRPDCTHILFIDNDMGFDKSLINRMLNLNEDVVGVISPRRKLNLQTLQSEKEASFNQALARSADFIFAPHPQGSKKDGFMQVNSCGAGIMLISRDCITRMMQSCPEIMNTRIYRKKHLSQGFETF